MTKIIDLDTLPEEEFLRHFGPPEFVTINKEHRSSVLEIVDDRGGRPWAFIDMAALQPDFLFYAGLAARVVQVGTALEIAIRAEFSERDPTRWRSDPGDRRVMRRLAWEAENAGLLPERLRQARNCNLAVELPARVEAIILVDR